MVSENGKPLTPSLSRMRENFGSNLRITTVLDLSKKGAIFVEDGNHSENRPRQNEFADVGIPFIRPPNLKDGRVDFVNCSRINDHGFSRVRKGIGRAGDIILTHRATVGRIAITSKSDPSIFVTNPGTTVWRSTDPNLIDQRYLYCFMRSPAFMEQLWGEVGNNCTFDYVSLTQQRGLRVAIPPLPEQKAIAHILGTLDEKIELNRRMNATLEGIARAIFKSWFVDFDPGLAKMDGRQPTGMDAATAALFPDGFEDSDLGKVPRGWKLEVLGDHVELQRGKTYKSKLKGTPGPYLLGLASIERNGGFRNDKLVTYGGDNPESLLVYPGDLYVSLKDVTQSADLLRAIARVPTSIAVGRMTQDTVKLVFRHESVSRNIVYRTLLTPDYRDYCRGHATGTTNLGLAREDFLSYPLIVPPRDIQKSFDRFIAFVENQIDTNVRMSRSLSRIRDTLLPKLLSGELRVPAATKMLEGV